MGQDDCLFCRIVAGTIPAARVLEDEAALAFLDVGPLAPGHVLLIPRTHAAQMDHLSPDQAAAMLRHLPSLVAAVKKVTGCEGVNVLQNNGQAAHQAIMHVHFHIIPRRGGDAFHFNWPAGSYEPGQMQELAGRIRRAVG